MDKMCFEWLLLTLIVLQQKVIAPPVSTGEQALTFLQKYGYVISEAGGDPSLVSMTNMKEGILDFQRFMGLDPTGELDNPTLKMMNKPRCGVKDEYDHFGRKKRYATEGVKWAFNSITYRISKYPKRIKNRRKVDREIARAFKAWRYETPLSFTEKKEGEVNIEIRFEERSHGDSQSFDGPGWTLAHATTPRTRGYVHFDDEEKWTMDEHTGTNLFQVAAHEFGHSLGLLHSSVKSSLMFPNYKEGEGPTVTLDKDDIQGIRHLYGNSVLDLCADSTIDAATTTADGRTYVFKGKYYWEVVEIPNAVNTGIGEGYPKIISDDWGGHPGDIDAALTWSNGQTFFFKRDKYWSFRNKEMDPGYPKLISEKFESIPMNIDAAFVWNNNTYFFKESHFWMYDSQTTPHISSAYPQSISDLDGIPDYLDAGLQWSNHKTYIFKGDKYYRVNDATFSLHHGFLPHPNLASYWWYNCMPA